MSAAVEERWVGVAGALLRRLGAGVLRVVAAGAGLRALPKAGAATEARGAGGVALVGAGPGSDDLITLRGLRRLRAADIVFYDRLASPALLGEARADARKVHVGKAPGDAAWSQERINAALVEAALAGLRVVRLKCGDPGIFARGAEEAEALAAAGVPCEIVPGVTAASAAAAAAGGFLTERGVTDTVVLTTGHGAGAGAGTTRDCTARPGTTLAVYMGVARVRAIADDLMAAGWPRDAPAEVVAAAGTTAERVLRCTLATLPEAAEGAGIRNPAMLFVRWPKAHAARAALRPVARAVA